MKYIKGIGMITCAILILSSFLSVNNTKCNLDTNDDCIARIQKQREIEYPDNKLVMNFTETSKNTRFKNEGMTFPKNSENLVSEISMITKYNNKLYKNDWWNPDDDNLPHKAIPDLSSIMLYINDPDSIFSNSCDSINIIITIKLLFGQSFSCENIVNEKSSDPITILNKKFNKQNIEKNFLLVNNVPLKKIFQDTRPNDGYFLNSILLSAYIKECSWESNYTVFSMLNPCFPSSMMEMCLNAKR